LRRDFKKSCFWKHTVVSNFLDKEEMIKTN